MFVIVAGMFPIVCGMFAMNFMRTEATQGVCPTPTGMGACVEECTEGSCRQGKLCCSNGCGHVCMEPVSPAQAEKPRKCVLLFTLKDADTKNPEALKQKAKDIVKDSPQPDDLHVIAPFSAMLTLTYNAGREADCCEAHEKLTKNTAQVRSVEFDGPPPVCTSAGASNSEIGTLRLHADAISAHARVAGKVAGADGVPHGPATGGAAGVSGMPQPGPIVGGPSPPMEVDNEAKAVWQKVLEHSPTYENTDLRSLGAPVSMQKQVVGGINYIFSFAGGQIVTVFYQAWTGASPEVTAMR